MACYSFSVSVCSRGKGQSVVSAAAYILRERLYDSYLGQFSDRRGPQDVVAKKILLPECAPRVFERVQHFLDALNTAEIRRDAQMAKIYKMALPNELSLEQQTELLEEFFQTHFITNGQAVLWAVHEGLLEQHPKPASIIPVDRRENNPHVHAIVPFRPLDTNGFQRFKKSTRQSNSREALIVQRAAWAECQNGYFEMLGLDVRVSSESLLVQGVQRLPTPHLGPAAMGMEQQGIPSRIGEEYRKVQKKNKKMDKKHKRDRARSKEGLFEL